MAGASAALVATCVRLGCWLQLSGATGLGGPVRNPIGANMSLRTSLAIEVGGFDASIGRVGSRPRGCEETELAIRLTMSRPKSVILYVPAAAVDHHVGKERLGFSYFLRRCWHEGLSKATVVRLAGLSAGLERERSHVAVVIPAALLRDLRSCASGDLTAFMRVTATIGGLATATAGYLAGRIRFAAHRRTRARSSPVECPWSRAGRYTAVFCKEKLDNHSLPGKAPGGGAPRLACPEHPSVAFSPAGTLHR